MSEGPGVEQAVEKASGSPLVLAVAWALVMVPLAYGVVETLIRVAALFTD